MYCGLLLKRINYIGCNTERGCKRVDFNEVKGNCCFLFILVEDGGMIFDGVDDEGALVVLFCLM